jgi:hypothetical protein
MDGSIFLLKGNNDLVEMRERAYDSESLLQRLLEDHSSLLAGDQMVDGEPKRWLLVKRETSVPDQEGGIGRWSLDHLFLDQDGVPTLVEIKRSSDTRIRREVVGQMLDYAANAVVYWSIDRVISEFESTCAEKGLDPDEVLAEHLNGELDVDSFWLGVQTNLQAGKVRMVFVADRIPSELQRIVEFLNGQMSPAEVLALEVRQFIGQSLTTLVPRVVGRTATAQQKKAVAKRPRKSWDEASFIESLESQGLRDEARAVASILGWASENGIDVGWGSGASNGSLRLELRTDNTDHQLCYIWTSNIVGFSLDRLRKRPPFDSPDMRRDLIGRLNRIAGVDLPLEKIESQPSFSLTVLVDDGARQTFLAVMRWMVAEIESAF